MYEPPRYMSVNEAVSQLLDVVKNRDLQEEPPGTHDFNEADLCPTRKYVGMFCVRAVKKLHKIG